MRHHTITSAAAVCCAASLAFLIAAGPARAQARDPKAIVLDMLQSPDPRQQAWGAWYAGRDEMRALVPAITAVVAQHHLTGMTTEERAATGVALDALIQMRATVPPDLLASLFDTQPTHALILASHEGPRPRAEDDDDSEDANTTAVNQALIDAMLREHAEHWDSTPWFAAANLLLDRRPPGFGRALVTGMRIRVRVLVSETGNSHRVSFSSGAFGIGCGIGSYPPAGLPPWAAYDLTRFAHPGVVVLAMGPVPVYYRRVPNAVGTLSSSRFDDGPSLRERLQYIAKLAHVDEGTLPIRDFESHEVKWAGAAGLTTSLRQIRADVHRRFAEMLQTMIEANAIERSEAASIAPIVEFDVSDERSDKSVPLGAP